VVVEQTLAAFAGDFKNKVGESKEKSMENEIETERGLKKKLFRCTNLVTLPLSLGACTTTLPYRWGFYRLRTFCA